MFIHALLLSLAPSTLAPSTLAPAEGSLLAAVPENAYALAHCRDIAGLRARAERNDWYRLLGSAHGEPLLDELARELHSQTRSEMDDLMTVADALRGEVVFFDTGEVAGFLSEPQANRAALAESMRGWLPEGGAAARRTLELAGGSVELAAWPDEIDGWDGRAGHYAAFLDHPLALALFSGDSSDAVLAALTESVAGLGSDRRAPLVSAYLDSSGGRGNGLELFVDFTPFIDEAEAVLKDAVEDVLPDPTALLGLEGGTWLRASFDLSPGTQVDCRAWLHLPQDTLAARLADTFVALPHSLPNDLPKGIWGMWALNWDLKRFYQIARAAYEEAGLGEGLETVDAGLDAARGMAGVDPVVDVLNQFEGVFAFYFVEPEEEPEPNQFRNLENLLMLGFHAGLVDGGAFQTAFEKLIDVGGIGEVLDLQDIAGVDAYVIDEDDGFNGGVAFLPKAFTIAPARRVLERALQALTRVEGASLLDGSPMQAAFDQNAGSCFFSCIEMTPMRRWMLPELSAELRLPPLEEGADPRDPFDSQLISSARRTAEGFEFRVHTR